MVAMVDKEKSCDDYEQEYNEDGEDKPFDYFQHFCHTIADRAKEIWILDDGYEAFQREYPFLCGHVDWNSMFPLPHQVNRNLFLGTRVFPLERNCLQKLEITHVIVSEFQKIHDWSELDGISVLRCSVKDENNQPMLPCWKACYQFITEALSDTPVKEESTLCAHPSCLTTGSTEAKARVVESEIPNLAALNISSLEDQCSKKDVPAKTATVHLDSAVSHSESERDVVKQQCSTDPRRVRILVLLHGRSRSSSVILAYLIKAYRMSFGQAWTYLCSKCWHIIDRSLVYVDQLKQWEQTELASIEEF